MPTVIENATALYNKLYDQSSIRTIGDQEVRVWEGKFVETALSIGIKYGSYLKVRKALEDIESIKLIESGNRGQPTVIVLLTEPTEDRWITLGLGDRRHRADKALTAAAEDARLEADVRTIIKQLGGLNIGQALINIEQRLRKVEEFVADKEGSISGKSKKSTNARKITKPQ